MRGAAKQLLCAFALMSLTALASHPATALANPPDFNGDGYSDLAVGVPNESVGAAANAGAVNIIYGRPGGLSALNNQLWTQDTPGVQDIAETGDLFGASRAWGDFNGDGYTDLAIGASAEDVGTIADAGAVHVLYGSPTGLTAAGNQWITQDSPGVQDLCETGDRFGMVTMTGDFNRDGYADLVVAAPYEDVGAIVDAGAVHIFFGSPFGLTAGGNQFITQDAPGVQDACETGDRFGYSLAAADFDSRYGDDLAVGVPFEDIGTIVDAGAVHIFYSNGTGLTTVNNQFLNQNAGSTPDACEYYDCFGYGLAAGRLTLTGAESLAVGVPFEDVGPIVNAGAVHIYYGQSGIGLNPGASDFWTQDSPGVADQCEADDRFGAVLAIGNFNDNRFVNEPNYGPIPDLVIGVPGEDINAAVDAGAVNILTGWVVGVRGVFGEFWHQDMPGILDVCENGDLLGASFWPGDFNGDGHTDLAIGVHMEDVGANADAGAVQVLYYAGVGLSAVNNQFWSQDSPGILDACEPGDTFGFGWR